MLGAEGVAYRRNCGLEPAQLSRQSLSAADRLERLFNIENVVASMRLTDYTDYTLRVLMYCASHPDRLVTISEIAGTYSISKNHLMKIVNDLGRQGTIETVRGRRGGLRMLKDPATLMLGDVVRMSEPDFRMVECFDPGTNECCISAKCGLKKVLHRGLASYFEALNEYSLADISSRAEMGAGNTSTIALPAPSAKKRSSQVA